MVKRVLMAVAVAAAVIPGTTAYAAEACRVVCAMSNPCDSTATCNVCVGKGSPVEQCLFEPGQV